MAVRPPPITTAGSRVCRLGSALRLNAPVSWSAIRKSLAFLMPRIRLFFMSMIVGLPAPAAIATWSNPHAPASSIGILAPNATPPRVLDRHRAPEAPPAVHPQAVAPRQRQVEQREEVLVPAHGDAVLGD